MHRHVLPRFPSGAGAHLLVQNPRVRIKHIYGLNSSSATQISFRSGRRTSYHPRLENIFISIGGQRPIRTHVAKDLAKTQADSARSALLPQVGFHAAFEADRQQFINKGGANWLVSIGLRWNLFNGNGDKAKIEESRHWMERAHADEQRVDSAVRLEVRRAWADLRAAEQRIEVAKAAVAEADESLRITQNRYEAGMNNVTDLLRNETAVLESRTRYLAAVHDQRIAATMLELAAGRLSPLERRPQARQPAVQLRGDETAGSATCNGDVGRCAAAVSASDLRAVLCMADSCSVESTARLPRRPLTSFAIASVAGLATPDSIVAKCPPLPPILGSGPSPGETSTGR